MSIIDAHVHVWTPDAARYPLAPGYKRENISPQSFTPEELFQHTRANGVERINLIQISFYGFDNRYMLEAIARFPEKFVGTAVIDPAQKVPDRQMVELVGQGVRAFRIHPRLCGSPAKYWLEPPGYERMFAAGARHNLAMSCLIEPDCLPELDRMCRKFPDTPVVIDHLCRIGVDGFIRDADVEALCKMSIHPRVHVKIGGFYALGQKKPPYLDLLPMIHEVLRAFGPRRCMWESDSPFQVAPGQTYRASIDLIQNHLPLLAEDRDWLLRHTAEQFFFTRQ